MMMCVIVSHYAVKVKLIFIKKNINIKFHKLLLVSYN